MELFGKVDLSKDPLTQNLLLNKNDFIRFLKTEKLFNKVETFNIYNEEAKEKEILNYYYEHRHGLKVKKYYKILRVKIEKTFYPPKLYLEKLERVNKTMHDLQDFEKQLFQKDVVSDVDSDDSEALRLVDDNNKRKQKVLIKEKTIVGKKNFNSKLVDAKKMVEFMKDHSELISRYLNFTKRKKLNNHKETKPTKSVKKDKDSKSESTCTALIVKKVVLKKNPKYDNFYKKRLRKEPSQNDQLKADTEYQLENIENKIEENTEGNKNTKNTKNSNTEQKETLNNSFMVLNKDPSFNLNANKNNGDNFFITNFRDTNEHKNLPNLISSNFFTSNKNDNNNYNNLLSSNSILNNSISQNNININSLDNETVNANKENKNKIVKYSQNALNFKNFTNSPSKVNNRPPSALNLLNSNSFNNNNNHINNLDYHNTSISSNGSIHLNKSIRNFNGNTNSMKKGNPNKKEHLVPIRVLSATTLNSNFSERKNFGSNKKSHEDSPYFDNNYFRAKSTNNFNQTQKKSLIKISNKERERMFRVKKLNEEISNMAPVNEDQLEKIIKRVDFKRGGNAKKVKSEFRASKFYQDKNYDTITSNFRKRSIDKLNAFYADKFNLNDNNNKNLDLKLNAQYRDYFTVDMENNNNNNFNMPISAEEMKYREQNPILIDFNARKKNKSIKNDLYFNKRDLNFIENKTLKKKNMLFNEIAKIDENSQMKKLELKYLTSDFKLPSDGNIKHLLFKAKKNIDLEELKGMVMDRIIEFKNSKGFLSEDFDSNKNINKISKVKYDLYNFINHKKK